MPIFGATLENATLFFTYNYVQGQLRQICGVGLRSSSSTQASSLLSSSASLDTREVSGNASTPSDAIAETPLPMSYLAVAAAAAGSATSLVLTPVELIKCKMQVQMVARELDVAAATGSRSVMTSSTGAVAANAKVSPAITPAAFRGLDGPMTLFLRTIHADGIRGLWLGQTGTLLRETGGGIAWFLSFEWACRTLIARKKDQCGRENITKKDLTSLELIGAGALAGISYNVILFPVSG